MSDSIPIGIINNTDTPIKLVMSGSCFMRCELDRGWYVLSNSGKEAGKCTIFNITFDIGPGAEVKFKKGF